MSRLNDLIRQLETKDASLARDLRREVEALSKRRGFGLNFERHVPEAVELPGRPVRRGDKVRVLPPRGSKPNSGDDRIWRVMTITKDASGKRTSSLELRDDAHETAAALVEDLVVVAEFRDPIYPGLVSIGKVERGGRKPYHAVINAENYHALQTLSFTHRASIDAIYVDPPYNTGNEGWIYNDRYITGDDLFMHSKWLAFIERRLLLAKQLLRSTGVIIVAIGDDEQHRLRMLMDQVFGPENFISNVVWQGGRKNDARYVSNGADYMLIYANSEKDLADSGVRWREPKAGVQEVIDAAYSYWQKTPDDLVFASKRLREWMATGSVEIDPGTKAYDLVDERGRAYSRVKMTSPNYRPNLMYEIIHPVTGKACPIPEKGWALSREEMARRIAAGRVSFGSDETTIPRAKQFLDESSVQNPTSVFERRRDHGSRHLVNVLGDKRFPNPKDPEVIERWIGLVAGNDATILDFFGGSGTTAEAVLRLNDRDGGRRRCILITNNELSSSDEKQLRTSGHRPGESEWEARGVFQNVAKPRIETVITGRRPDGSKFSDGFSQNVEFFNLTYEAPLRVSSNREFAKIAPLLWLRSGS